MSESCVEQPKVLNIFSLQQKLQGIPKTETTAWHCHV